MARPLPGGAEVLQGGCLCGAVRFEVTGPYAHPSICHCSMCRKAAGAPYMVFVTVPRARLRLLSGTFRHYRSSEMARRGFCADCGTALSWEGDKQPDVVDIAIAALDDPAQVPPQDQIFAADAIAWVDGVSRLPSYPAERTR